MRDPRACETVIVGGGIIGLAVAYELLRKGRRVVVFERERPGAGATAVAAGMLAAASEADVDPPALTTFALESAARYADFVRGLEETTGIACRLRTEGTLWVAVDRDDVRELERLHEIQAARRIPTRIVTGAEVRAKEPRITARATLGLWVEGDRSVDPRSLTRALVAAIEGLGGRIERGTVASIEPHDRGLALEGRWHDHRTFSALTETVVLAAGAWSGNLRTPLDTLSVRPVKGEVVRLRGAPLLDHCVRTPRVYLVPRGDGELVIGATAEERGFDSSTNAGAVRELLRHAWEVVPGIDELAVEELGVGFRPAACDHLPVIGAAGLDGLYVATGHYRHGVLLAPATAQELAELIVTGRPRPVLAPFQLDRLRGAAR